MGSGAEAGVRTLSPHRGASDEEPSGSEIQQPTWPLSLPALRSGLLSLSVTNTHTVSQNRDLGVFTQLTSIMPMFNLFCSLPVKLN